MIQYITYKKKKYPVRVSYIALNGFTKDTGKKFTDLDQGVDLEDYEPLIFHALKAGCHAEDVEMPCEREEIPYVLDECLSEFLEVLPLFFPNNEPGKSVEKPKPSRPQRRKEEREGKKKA